MVTLFDQFQKTVRKFPKNKAFCFFEDSQLVSWTYQEVYDKIVALSEGLRSIGLKKGDRVAIISPNRPEWILVDLAVARNGMVLIPIHTTLSGEQTRRIIRQSHAKAIAIGTPSITESFYALHEFLPGLETSILQQINNHFPFVKNLILLDRKNPRLTEKQRTYYLSELIEKGEDRLHRKKQPTMVDVHPSDLSTIMYTSGTTGEMKGVMLCHRNIAENALMTSQHIGAHHRDIYLSILPMSHAYERIGFMTNLFYGSTIAFSRGPKRLIEDLQVIQPSWTSVVPRLLEKMCIAIREGIEKKSRARAKFFQFGLSRSHLYRKLYENKNPIASLFYIQHHVADRVFHQKIRMQLGNRLRYIACGGASLDPQVSQFFYSLGIRILEGYGLRENSPIVTINPPEKQKSGSVGTPLSKVRVRIGKDDEILVKGPTVMLGYEGNLKETQRVIDKDGWLHTGDQGYFDKDGYLYIKGRIKEMFITSYGKNVFPTAVEQEIEKSHYLNQVMVYGDNRPYLIALVVPEREKLEQFAKKIGLKNINWPNLCLNQKIKELIQKEIQNSSKSLAHHEQVKKFCLIDEEFTEQNNCLTPTLKLRRSVIAEKYKQKIEELYR